ncbi:uncharacterized protein [Diabrotica undecimpunctata]|uniref:uncharacterized protein n=1 Tax=Diabrotica undecimpunctata TaxID=50387 RepID=UPI003B641195
MDSLLRARVNQAHPFENAGVNYAGPIKTRANKGRGYKSYKQYIAVFACLVTKAVHLEVVSDMTADTFVAAFKRFNSRRGYYSHIYSDNETSFVGAANLLFQDNEKVKVSLTDTLTTLLTHWHYIPAYDTHFLGL